MIEPLIITLKSSPAAKLADGEIINDEPLTSIVEATYNLLHLLLLEPNENPPVLLAFTLGIKLPDNVISPVPDTESNLPCLIFLQSVLVIGSPPILIVSPSTSTVEAVI